MLFGKLHSICLGDVISQSVEPLNMRRLSSNRRTSEEKTLLVNLQYLCAGNGIRQTAQSPGKKVGRILLIWELTVRMHCYEKPPCSIKGAIVSVIICNIYLHKQCPSLVKLLDRFLQVVGVINAVVLCRWIVTNRWLSPSSFVLNGWERYIWHFMVSTPIICNLTRVQLPRHCKI